MNLLPEIDAIEDKAFKICKEKAVAKKLDMKLISVKCLFDKTKIIFYFVAENRIDFRELVRELAAIFRTRIEMRQIGVRDEARLVGGYGPCGRQHCCVHKRQEFDPVSIKMAKEQDLNLNSLKISGMCGRLLCCLGYEYAVYKELNEKLPKLGTEIIAGDKKFTVESVDTLKESLQIKNAEQTIEISNNDIEIIKGVHILKKNVLDRINNPDDDTNEEF
jgi:cell fate regulator YaaT (PSP1 superfamily)